jgi:hypothetical protein
MARFLRRFDDDTWSPGGPGGSEKLAQKRDSLPDSAPALHRRRSAKALHGRWTAATDEFAGVDVLRRAVSPQVFNAFRRDRLDAGFTDEQLAASFRAFITAVTHGLTSVRQGDLWRTYAGSWPKWLSAAPAPTERRLRGHPDGVPLPQR